MISILDNVELTGLQTPTLLAMMIVQGICIKMNVDANITSVMDGVHSLKSLHYAGFAFDVVFNPRGAEGNIVTLYFLIVDALTPEFDVVSETTHIHIEYQPKRVAEPGHEPHT